MKNKVNQNKVSASGEPNVQALARAGESENHAQDIGGALPAAPCSACGSGLSEHTSESIEFVTRSNGVNFIRVTKTTPENKSETVYRQNIAEKAVMDNLSSTCRQVVEQGVALSCQESAAFLALH